MTETTGNAILAQLTGEENMRQNSRYLRAAGLAHEVLKIVYPHLDRLADLEEMFSDIEGRPAEGPSRKDLFRHVKGELMEILMAQGVEIMTDRLRQEIGLPPRGPDGWTVEEIIALEQRRLDEMQRRMDEMMKPIIVWDRCAKCGRS